MVLTKLLAAAGLAAAQTSYAIAGQRQCQPLGPGARCKVKKTHPKPAYDSFWSSTAFCRHVVGCLYRADVEMYVSACRAPALETCAAFRSACEVQLGRLRDVCGLDV